MKKLIFTLTGLVLALMPLSGVAASSYNGTTVNPEADGITYEVYGEAGDVITLANVGGNGGSLKLNLKDTVDCDLVVESTSTRPADAPTAPPGTLNIYFDVTLCEGVVSADISPAVWTFVVLKSWLASNGVTVENLFLHHYTGSAWERLTTRQVSSTDTTVTLEADVPSFSAFAITAVPGLSSTGFPYMLGALLSIGALAVLTTVFMVSRKKRSIFSA